MICERLNGCGTSRTDHHCSLTLWIPHWHACSWHPTDLSIPKIRGIKGSLTSPGCRASRGKNWGSSWSIIINYFYLKVVIPYIFLLIACEVSGCSDVTGSPKGWNTRNFGKNPSPSNHPKVPHFSAYGRFLKYGYPEIIHCKKIFHYKPSIFWVLWKPPYLWCYNEKSNRKASKKWPCPSLPGGLYVLRGARWSLVILGTGTRGPILEDLV